MMMMMMMMVEPCIRIRVGCSCVVSVFRWGIPSTPGEEV